MKTGVFRSALLLLAAVLTVCLTGCPLQKKFDITLRNTGGYPITGAYFTPSGNASWGENLLAEPLLSGEFILIENLPHREYDFLCTFGGNNDEGQPATLEQPNNWPPGQGLDCVTWEASYSENGDWFFGYNWGCEDL